MEIRSHAQNHTPGFQTQESRDSKSEEIRIDY